MVNTVKPQTVDVRRSYLSPGFFMGLNAAWPIIMVGAIGETNEAIPSGASGNFTLLLKIAICT